jgi:hypothetical protein
MTVKSRGIPGDGDHSGPEVGGQRGHRRRGERRLASELRNYPERLLHKGSWSRQMVREARHDSEVGKEHQLRRGRHEDDIAAMDVDE